MSLELYDKLYRSCENRGYNTFNTIVSDLYRLNILRHTDKRLHEQIKQLIAKHDYKQSHDTILFNVITNLRNDYQRTPQYCIVKACIDAKRIRLDVIGCITTKIVDGYPVVVSVDDSKCDSVHIDNVYQYSIVDLRQYIEHIVFECSRFAYHSPTKYITNQALTERIKYAVATFEVEQDE